MKDDKVVLVELSGIHYEVLHSHIKCLKESGYYVVLLCYEDIKGEKEIYSEADRRVLLDDSRLKIFKPFQALQMVRLMIEERCRNLIFATADSGILMVRILLLMLALIPLKLNIVRCIHNLKTLKESFWDTKIFNRRFKKVLFLNDYLISNNEEVISKMGLYAEAFYPVFFSDFENCSVDKKEEKTWICIPGYVSFDKKDYTELLKQIEIKDLNERIKFIILGGTKFGKEKEIEIMNSKIKQLGFEDQFKLFDNKYIPKRTFMAYAKESDYIMPLVHPSKREYEKYLKNKISGAFNLAFGLKKPLLSVEDYKGYKDFDNFSVFYREKEMIKTINRIPRKEINVPNNSFYSKKMSTEEQSKRYKRILEK